MEAGVPTELHVYPGLFHGSDMFVPDADTSVRFLADRNAALTIQDQSPVAAPAGAVGVAIAARATDPDGRETRSVAECRFAIGRTGPDGLIGLRFGHDELSDQSLYILKRFWLATPDSDGADPQPVAIWRLAPTVSVALARGLQQGLSALPGM